MVENTFTTEFATASALVSAAVGVAVAALVLAASASAVAARTTTDGTARLATKSSVLRRLRKGELKFICFQDNGIWAGKPSPFFKSRVTSWSQSASQFLDNRNRSEEHTSELQSLRH